MTSATEEERMEALSHRYVDAARVVLLASGRYAIFTMASGHIVAVATEAELPAAIAEACRLSAAAWNEAKAEEASRRNREPLQLPGTLEDLGL